MVKTGRKAAALQKRRHFAARLTIEPSGKQPPSKRSSPPCPDCGSAKVFRNGTAKNVFDAKIQRYLCRSCGRRFSDPDDLKKAKAVADSYLAYEDLNVKDSINQHSQVCVMEKAKNLMETTEKTGVSQREKLSEHGIDLVIADYEQYIRKEHLVGDLTLSKYVPRLKWLATKIGVDLFDPEDFKRKLAFNPELSNKSNGNKNSICKAYTSFVKKYLHMEDVKIPHFEYKPPEYNVPQTQHMELLYAAFSFQMQVFCFVQMATAARPIEALRIEWKDIDFARKTIAINKPAKHGRTRTVQLKGRFVKVIDMLAELKNRQHCYLPQQKTKKP
jgi:predicted RNA-binding Zn-ribbon protein involved in translation (DUF1610 family)